MVPAGAAEAAGAPNRPPVAAGCCVVAVDPKRLVVAPPKAGAAVAVEPKAVVPAAPKAEPAAGAAAPKAGAAVPLVPKGRDPPNIFKQLNANCHSICKRNIRIALMPVTNVLPYTVVQLTTR